VIKVAILALGIMATLLRRVYRKFGRSDNNSP